MSEQNGKRLVPRNGHELVSLNPTLVPEDQRTVQTIIPVPVNDSTKQDETNLADEVARYVTAPESELILGEPPLLTRKQKQARKGLPAPENLRKLAKVWLETTRELWPELISAGLLPAPTDDVIDQLVRDFERRFVSGQPEEYRPTLFQRFWRALAAGYVRYSDDNSNPRSLDDQIVKELRRAKIDGRFIPWEYVFADASVSGRTHLQRGYRLGKESMERFRDSDLDTLYIDDFGRATRSGIESYRLAKLMDRLRKNLIGVSDGFDLASPAAEIQVAAAGMFNSWFVRQLRQKVLRGMKGAVSRGTSTGRVRLGYRLVPKLDKNGQTVMHEGKSKEHKPIMVPTICPEDMAHVIQAAKWFGDQFKSYKWIARQFNAMKVAGRMAWTCKHIKTMLECPVYIGVVIYNRTHTVLDEETGELTIEDNPRSEWVIRVAPELKAWDDELWKKVRRRAAWVRDRAPNTGRQYHRGEVHPAALLSETLECGSCHQRMQLIRSDTRNDSRQYGCTNGSGHVKGCKYSSSKSARIVDSAVLAWVREHVLTEENFAALVERANFHLAEEAKRPRINVEPLRKQIATLVDEERSVTQFVLANRDKHDMAAYLNKGDELRRQIKAMQQQLRERESANAAPPPPLDLPTVMKYLPEMRELLNSSVEKSAAMLRALSPHTSGDQLVDAKSILEAITELNRLQLGFVRGHVRLPQPLDGAGENTFLGWQRPGSLRKALGKGNLPLAGGRRVLDRAQRRAADGTAGRTRSEIDGIKFIAIFRRPARMMQQSHGRHGPP